MELNGVPIHVLARRIATEGLDPDEAEQVDQQVRDAREAELLEEEN